VEKEYLPHLRYMYNNHLSIHFCHEIYPGYPMSPLTVRHRFISDGPRLLYSRDGFGEWEQDAEIDRKLGVLRRYGGSGGHVVIPDNVTIIAEEAFFLSRDVTSVVIPASVRRIETDAFRGCRDLGQVTFQGKQTQLGARSFDGKNLVFCCPGFSPALNYALEHGIRVQVTEWD